MSEQISESNANSVQYSSKLIFAESSIRADMIFCGLADAPLCVTFTERGNKIITGSGFGGRILLDEGFDVLAIKNVADDWYQSVDAQKLAALQACVKGSKTRSGYGSSMGAYAAIRFSKALDLGCVWALSPISDIRHDWDRRYHVDIAKIAGDMLVPAMMSASCHYFVAYDDQLDADGRHIDEIQRIAPTNGLIKIRVPNAGHPVGPALRDAGMLKPLTVSILRDKSLTLALAAVEP